MVDKYKNLIEPLLIDSNNVEALNINLSHLFVNPEKTFNKSVCKTPPLTPRANVDKFYLIPELYYVPKELVEEERKSPNTQPRIPNDNVPLVWANSLYILGCLIHENLLEISQVDPLGRRHQLDKMNQSSNVVIQMVILSETKDLQNKLATLGLDTQIVKEILPFNVCKPSALKEIYGTLGMNKKLGLSGRPNRPIGTLGTCRLYKMQGNLIGFTPYFMDQEEFYLSSDNQYLISIFEQELLFIQNNWHDFGRPTMIVMLTESMIKDHLEALLADPTSPTKNELSNITNYSLNKNLFDLFYQMKTGKCNGVRVRLGKINEFINTSCVTSLDFLINRNDIDFHKEIQNHSLERKSSISLPVFSLLESTTAETPLTSSYEKIIKAGIKSPRLRSKVTSSIWGDSTLKTPLDNNKKKEYFDWTESGNAPSPTKRSGSPVRGMTIPSPLELSLPDKFKNISMVLGNPSRLNDAIVTLPLQQSPYDQIDLIHYIYSCEGLDFYIQSMGAKVDILLEEIYKKAIHHKLWSIVRQAAGLLHKMANSLTVNLTNLIINRKIVTIGEMGNEYIISTPLTPDRIESIIFDRCKTDIREAPIVQEVLTYLGNVINSDPALFEGILTLRTHYIILALREEISRIYQCNEDDGVEYLLEMSPYEMSLLLATTLSGHMLSMSDSNIFIRDKQYHKKSKDILICKASDDVKSININVQSGGFKAGNFSTIEINEEVYHMNDRGFNLILVDCKDGVLIEQCSFDTHGLERDSMLLTQLINGLKSGVMVIGAVKDEATESLTDECRIALGKLGCGLINTLSYRDSYAFIGFKGASKGSIPESLKAANEGATDILFHKVEPYDSNYKYYYLFDKNNNEVKKTKDIPLPNEMIFGLSTGKWLRRRKNDGSYCRVPPNFYPDCWNLLADQINYNMDNFVINGIRCNNHFFPREPTIFEKTSEELNFARLVEVFLSSSCKDPAEIQVSIKLIQLIIWILNIFKSTSFECKDILSKLNNESFNKLKFLIKNGIDLSLIINKAIELYWSYWMETYQQYIMDLKQEHIYEINSLWTSKGSLKDIAPIFLGKKGLSSNMIFAKQLFYDLPDHGKFGVVYFLAKAFFLLAELDDTVIMDYVIQDTNI